MASTTSISTTTTDDVAMAPPENKENQTKNASNNNFKSPWVEAYRPRTLADVLGNEETVSRLQAIAKDGNLPNLILCGPPGTGAYAFLRIAMCCIMMSHNTTCFY